MQASSLKVLHAPCLWNIAGIGVICDYYNYSSFYTARPQTTESYLTSVKTRAVKDLSCLNK